MRKNRKTSGPNSGAMADIAFLLLIFFMVATTFQREKSISMKLPPLVDGPPQKVLDKKVLTILINGANEVMIENDIANKDLSELVAKHLSKMIDLRIKPILNVKMHPQANYHSYLHVLSDIKAGIRITKGDIAEKRFGKSIEKLSSRQYKDLNAVCGIRIMEAEITI